MTFTYEPADSDFLATDLGRVRRRTGDTIAVEATWTDEEIEDALLSTGSVAGAVAELLATVPGDEARQMLGATTSQVAVLSRVVYPHDPYADWLTDEQRAP